MNLALPTRLHVKRALPLGGVLAALALAACGSQTSAPQEIDSAVSGVVSSDGEVGSVKLTDASDAAQQRTASVDEAGAFSFDVAGLAPPYILEARSSRDGRTTRLASIATGAGWANVNPITDAALVGASADDGAGATNGETMRLRAQRFEAVVAQLQARLKPLLDAYGVPADPFRARAPDPALRAMLADVRFEVAMGNVAVTNRATGALIFTGPLGDLASGTFDAGAISGGGGTTAPAPTPDGPALYAARCAACHGALAASTRRGRTAAQILAAHGSIVTAAEAEALAGALAAAPVAACTAFSYSDWGACQQDGTQSRTIASSSPAGCGGGSPVLTQSCTYSPPTVSCTTCHGIPPASGEHAKHAAKVSCASCHGSGYGTTTVNAATHQDDVTSLTTTIGWNGTSRTCANSCHGAKSW